MKKTQATEGRTQIALFRSADRNTAFNHMSAAEILPAYGYPKSLLSSSAKSKKCDRVGVSERILFLTPGLLCRYATPGCRAACLGHSSGRMQMPTHALARDRRTALYLESPDFFLQMLKVELSLFERHAHQRGLKPAIRLNGSSDLPWEDLHPDIFTGFPGIQFFDYTKSVSRMSRFLDRTAWPANYYLTFSAHSENPIQAADVLKRGGTAALVFWPTLPSSFWGFPVIDGEEHDARFLDPSAALVGLRAKGLARRDVSGFTVRTDRESASAGIAGILPATATAEPRPSRTPRRSLLSASADALSTAA